MTDSSAERLTVYTAQHRAVVDMVTAGAVYFPDWDRTRPFNRETDAQSKGGLPFHIRDRLRPQRQFAYRWLADQFMKRMSRADACALVFGFVDRRLTDSLVDDDDVVLTLSVPPSEVLSMRHTPWSAEILAGSRLLRNLMPHQLMNPPVLTDLETWETIFDVDPNDRTEIIQVVIDRIEPQWVVQATNAETESTTSV